MFKVISIFVICVFAFLCPFRSIAQSVMKAQNGGFQLPTMTSDITTSANGEYVFALLSSRSIDKEVKEVRKNWEIDNLSKETIIELEKMLLRDVEKEKSIRLKYKESGLYENSSNKQIFKVESFPKETDRIYVANDGTYIVGFNPFVFVQDFPNIKPEDILKSQEVAFFRLTSETSDVNKCSYKINELNLENDSVIKTSDGYFWADKEAVLNNQSNALEINKSSGENLIFDVKNCKIIDNDIQKISNANYSEKKDQSFFCLGIILCLLITFFVT